SHLWMTEWGPLFPDRIHRVDISDPQIPISFRAPTAAARSLTSDGTHLWLADTGTNRVYKVDKTTGLAVDQFASTLGSSPRGVASDGGDPWVADSTANIIYRLRQAVRTALLSGQSGNMSGLALAGSD